MSKIDERDELWELMMEIRDKKKCDVRLVTGKNTHYIPFLLISTEVTSHFLAYIQVNAVDLCKYMEKMGKQNTVTRLEKSIDQSVKRVRKKFGYD